METGRPIIVSCFSPFQSVQGWLMTTSFAKAALAKSAANWRMRAAEMPTELATASGEYASFIYVSVIIINAGVATPPASRGISPCIATLTFFVLCETTAPVRRSITCGSPSPSRKNNPSFAAPGLRITSQGEFV